MNNKAIYIGLGVVALGGLAYFMMRKKDADATTSEGAEIKSAEATDPTGGRGIVPPTKGSPSQGRPNTPNCGCGTGQTPCPNVRCASKTQVTPTNERAGDLFFQQFGITKTDYQKMKQAAIEIKTSLKDADVETRAKELRQQLRAFARKNNISVASYKRARQAMTSAEGSVSPQADSETETFAFTLNF